MAASHAGQIPWNKGVSTPVSVRVKQSASLKGRAQTPEHVQKRTASLKGRVPWNKGKKLSTSIIEKYRRAQTGKKLSEATKEKLREHAPWNKGKKLSLEHRANLAAARRGKKHSPAAVEKMRVKALERETERRRRIRESFVEMEKYIERPVHGKHWRHGADVEWIPVSSSRTSSPSASIELREARQLIADAMRGLSPMQFECMMHYYFGSASSISEIARLLGINPRKVWRAIAVGNAYLRHNPKLKGLLY